MSEIQHEDKCRWWDDEEFCDCGALAVDKLERDNAALRARITELTQSDPSWYDMSFADAFRLWKADRERAEALEASLSRCRADALEEAARVVDTYRIERCKSHRDDAVDTTAANIAEDIRALKAPQESASKKLDDAAKILSRHYPCLKDGAPCDHPGCASHFSHPCEGCGRIGARTAPTEPSDDCPDGQPHDWAHVKDSSDEMASLYRCRSCGAERLA